jgi:peroxiredoxin
VVPIFDDGRCFYTTDVAPFKGRNSNAVADEQALCSLMSAARKSGVPVYIGMDVLGWQKTQPENKAAGVFGKLPQLQEISKGAAQSARPEALYASPFNPEVRSIVTALVKEIATKFPEASGLVLDVRLSGGEILGYSEAARAASILEKSIDPIDLNISNAANAIIDAPVREWIEWRRGAISNFVKAMTDTYHKSRPGSQVFASGYADYYSQRAFNDYRSSQDWMGWLSGSAVDGVLLEGRWSARYYDSEYLQNFLKPDSAQGKAGKTGTVVPVSNGDHLMRDGDYQRDWNSLKSRISSLNQIALVARNDNDLKRIVALASGQIMLSQLPRPETGGIAPEFFLKTPANEMHSLKDWSGQRPLLLFLTDGQARSQQSLQSFSASTAKLSKAGVEPIVISTKPVQVTEGINLLDPANEIVSQFGGGSTLVEVDKAGFVRRIENVKDGDIVLPASIATPKLEVGLPAPDFIITDMNGKTVRLSDFKGKKNLLLTFFPKCFTGGCQNHLSSLRDHKAEFDAADTAILAVSIDPADVQIAFAAQWSLPFPLIPDTGRNLSLLYGAAVNTEQLADRQSVLIDKNGIVRLVDRQVNVSTHGHDILEKMRELGLAK